MSAFQQSSVHSLLVALQPQIVYPLELPLVEEICTIGRSSGCNLVVNNQLVSRLHAHIERLGARYVIADAGSANGTYLNGRRIIKSQQLRNDDHIGLGSPTALLRFMDPDATILASGILRYDEGTRNFFLSGTLVELPPVQFRLLYHLYLHAGDICTRSSCAQAIWGREYDPTIDPGAFDTALSELRRLLRQIDAGADLIDTRRSLGYLLRL